MAHKWTDEQKAKFKRTMKAHYAAKKRAAKHEPKMGPVEIMTNNHLHPDMLPVMAVSGNGANGEAAEFAAAFAAAWRAYKGG